MSKGYSDFGEDVIREGLSNRGWFVIPTGKIQDGGAPMARSCSEALIIPDLQIMAAGQMNWVEVKRKKRPAFMRIEGCEKHGFCKRQWRHYQQIEKETGVTVWLFIWETQNKIICYAPIRYLKYPQYRNPRPFKEQTSKGNNDFCEHGMVFFRRDDFWIINETTFLSGAWNDYWIHGQTGKRGSSHE